MKTVLRTAVAGLAVASFGISSNAWAATETATATAEILDALDIDLDATRNTLDFGTIAESGTGGTLTLTPAGAATCGAGLVCGGTTETPLFTIDGEADAPVGISFTSSTIQLSGPGADMPVALTLSDVTMTLDNTGAGDFEVGGTLTVGGNQATGTYTGQLEVVVVYN